jgi:glycosyltransferase involved in cell wall biosynthesis
MNNDTPLVSVIVATYNWSSVLRYALLSIQAQTFKDFEAFVIGDGCTDDSQQVVESLSDPRFHWENLPINHGHQSAPNNHGLALARGHWIAYLGHDDLWMPNHLELLLAKVDETIADVAFSLAVLIGAPGCDGRMLFPAFERGEYERDSVVPPSALIHRRVLVERSGNWPNHRETSGCPEGRLLTQFYDNGAKFVSLPKVTVFKFPSYWRPYSYVRRSCEEQAKFFSRMCHERDFLHSELIEVALATQLLKPHTRAPVVSPEDNLRRGAVVEAFRRSRGLTAQIPEESVPRYVTTGPMSQLISTLADEEIQRRQRSQFVVSEIFWGQEGHYSAANSERAVIPLGRWNRLRIRLLAESDGAPLRFDPCDRPALIEVAWVALRRNGSIEWCARRQDLATLTIRGDAFLMKLDRVLTIRSRGNDPILLLPANVSTKPPLMFDCWMRISAVSDV